VCGKGEVFWDIEDFYGTCRSVITDAYFVPSATIRLFSPQVYIGNKLQPCTTCTIFFPTKYEYKNPLMSLQEATSSTAVIKKTNNGYNLLHHQHLTFKATVHKNTTSALWPTQPGPGRNTYHQKLHTLKLRLLRPWLKLKWAEIIQCLINRPLETN